MPVSKLFCKKRDLCDRFGELKTCDGYVYVESGKRFYECRKFFTLLKKAV